MSDSEQQRGQDDGTPKEPEAEHDDQQNDPVDVAELDKEPDYDPDDPALKNLKGG